MRVRLVISTLAALAGGLLALVAIQPEGDSSATVRDLEQKLDAAFQRRVTYTADTPQGGDLAHYEVSIPDGCLLEFAVAGIFWRA